MFGCVIVFFVNIHYFVRNVPMSGHFLSRGLS